MSMHTSYTDRYSADEAYDGDWDDIMSPDEYEDYIDRVQYAKSQGLKRPVYRPQRNGNPLSDY